MSRIYLILALILSIMLACWTPLYAQDIFAPAIQKVGELRALIDRSGSPVNTWHYRYGDIKNGWDPKLDDSQWALSTSSDFFWGNYPSAWLRTRITIPEQINGCKVDGNAVYFKCRARDDDEGILYVNGKMVQRFYSDEGKYLLSEYAVPGEKFDIAIQGFDKGTDGRGGLNDAWLELGIVEDASHLVFAFYYSMEMYATADKTRREPYVRYILDGMSAVDTEALRAGNTSRFLDSLKIAESNFGRLDEFAKDLDIRLVGHAHIDCNWLWDWPETVRVCKNTFGTACKLMDEYPDFKFSQSQGALYLAMQEDHPEIFEKIKERVKRGQWDITAATWTEGDNNMSSGEAIVRSILYTKRYIKKQFGIESAACWEPDTFGHPWTLPQILAKSGIKYYYFTRCGIGSPIFWWQSPDGSRVLANNSDGYSYDITDSMASDALRASQASGAKTQMWVYGVGDHGGGPTRAMLENASRLQKRPEFPKMKFDKVSNYFNATLNEKQDYRVWNSELNTIFEGCYTTHADIKLANRRMEALLPCAEKFSTIALSPGNAYPARGFEQSWRSVCFNQFHDILCGAAIHESYNYSKKLYSLAGKQAQKALEVSLKTLESNVNTNGQGIPIVVFNPLSWTRTENVEVKSPFPDGALDIQVSDASGMFSPAQVEAGRLCFTSRDVPALGYKVFWAKRVQKPVGSKVTSRSNCIENEFFRVTIDPNSGTLSSIYDKANARELLQPQGGGIRPQILLEEPHGMSAWSIGAIQKTIDLYGEIEPIKKQSHLSRADIKVHYRYGNSSIVQKFILCDGVPRIDIKMVVNWNEKGGDSVLAPMLKLAFPIVLNNPKATFEIPYGSIERPTDGKEVPAQKWIDLSEQVYGVSILNDCKYGFDVNGNLMRMTLLRSSYEPDPNPDGGIHEITCSIYPHKGDWRVANTVRCGYEINEPLIARTVDKHSGLLPSAQSYVSSSAPSLIITALKQAEDRDGTILRFYESSGQACKTRIKVKLPVKSYIETDLMERPVGKKMAIRGDTLEVSVGKWEIKTYKLLR